MWKSTIAPYSSKAGNFIGGLNRNLAQLNFAYLSRKEGNFTDLTENVSTQSSPVMLFPLKFAFNILRQEIESRLPV